MTLHEWPLQASAAALLLALLSGCASLRNGGVPESLPTVASDRDAIVALLETDGGVAKVLTGSGSVGERNRFVTARLIAIDQRYFAFISLLRAERQQGEVGTQLAQVGLGLAGVATAATRAKSNLAAAGATLTGVKAIIDKEYYFDKTVPALISVMNARRLAVLKAIKDSMNQPVSQWGARDVLADLDAYERAGQLGEAIAVVETQAKAEETQGLAEVRSITQQPDDAITKKAELNARIAKLSTADDDGKNRKLIDDVTKALGGEVRSQLKHADAFTAMWSAFRRANVAQIVSAAALIAQSEQQR